MTIDDDIAALVEAEMKRSGKPYKTVINDLLRLGLVQKRQRQAQRHFRVKPRAMGLRAGQSYDNVAVLLEELEGPQHK